MERIILACSTLRDEVETVLREAASDTQVVWIPSGLHNVPGELRERLQAELDALPPVEHVLMAMAFCGNSVAGLKSRNFRLTIPRMDDCISLLLGTVKNRVEAYKGVYFMTAGWLRGERSLLTEYEYVVAKYGAQRGKRIFQAMFRNYTDVALLDSGCFDRAAAEAEMRETARILGMSYREYPGDLTLLRQLLQGPWPEEQFLTVGPDTEITEDMLTLMGHHSVRG